MLRDVGVSGVGEREESPEQREIEGGQDEGRTHGIGQRKEENML